jgi:hypothetical protein
MGTGEKERERNLERRNRVRASENSKVEFAGPDLIIPSHHSWFYSKTGVVYNVAKRSVGVIVYKRVGNRKIEKRVNLRVEHVKHSTCRDEFYVRVKRNDELKKAASAAGSEYFWALRICGKSGG